MNLQVLAGDWDSYQYLVESIRQFPPQEEFAQMIKDAGFRLALLFSKSFENLSLIVKNIHHDTSSRFVDFENLTFGVAAVHSGFKL